MSLRRHFTFDDVFGQTVFDEMGGGDFTVTSDITFTSGKIGNAIQTPPNVITAKASSSSHGVYSTTSISFWVNVTDWTSTVGFPNIVASTDFTDGWEIYFRTTTTTLNMRVWDGGVGASITMAWPTASVGQWDHIAGVIDTESNEMKFYRNGTLETTAATSMSVPGSLGLSIGNRLTPASNTVFYGQVDDLRIYDHALSASQVADIIKYPTIKPIIKRGTNKGFRRLWMKRKFGADYESEWQRIPDDLVQSWGTVQFAVEDIKPNFYSYSGITLQVNNKDGYFNDIDDSGSFFFGAITRHNTLIKVEAGYETPGGLESPTNPVVFQGLLRSDSIINHNRIIDLQCEHLTKIFEEFQSDRITHLRDTMTASEIMAVIRDHSDIYQNSYFQKFITSGAWAIDTTTLNYFVSANDLPGVSTWEFMNKIAEADDKMMYMTRHGRFRYQSKTTNQSTAVWHFSGLGDTDLSYGSNMQVGLQQRKPISKVRNRISIKHKKGDTVTSYKIKEEPAEWGVANSSNKYGVRKLDIQNFYMTATTADSLATALFNRFSEPLKYVNFSAQYVPQLLPNDRVTLTYIQHSVTSATGTAGSFYDSAEWDEGKFASFKNYNVNINNKDFKIVKINHDLNSFLSQLEVVEI